MNESPVSKNKQPASKTAVAVDACAPKDSARPDWCGAGSPDPAAARAMTVALARCFLRSYLVAAAFNTRGMQNVGVVYALEPGLRRIYSDPEARRDARMRYATHYNTHPFWTPLLVGVFLSVEDKISKGLFPAQVLISVKDATTYALSAIGDSLFAGSLLVFFSLMTACLVAAELPWLALAWGLTWFAGLQGFKIASFVLGYKEGLKFLTRLKRWKLIDWAQRLKYGNAVLLALFLHLAWPQAMPLVSWALGMAVVGLAALAVYYGGIGREVLVILVLAVAVVVPWLLDGV